MLTSLLRYFRECWQITWYASWHIGSDIWGRLIFTILTGVATYLLPIGVIEELKDRGIAGHIALIVGILLLFVPIYLVFVAPYRLYLKYRPKEDSDADRLRAEAFDMSGPQVADYVTRHLHVGLREAEDFVTSRYQERKLHIRAIPYGKTITVPIDTMDLGIPTIGYPRFNRLHLRREERNTRPAEASGMSLPESGWITALISLDPNAHPEYVSPVFMTREIRQVVELEKRNQSPRADSPPSLQP